MAEMLRQAGPAAAGPDGQFRDVIEALSEGFALFDPEGVLVACNARFRAFTATLADLVAPGARWELLLHESQARGVIDRATADRLRLVENRLDPGAAPELVEFTTLPGRDIVAAMSATRLGAMVLTLRDVTARREVEAREREADLLLRRVLEACPAHVVMSRVDDGEIIYRSPATTELIGPVRNMRDYFASRDEQADLTTAFLPDGRVNSMAVTCLRRDGGRFPASVSARMIDYRGEDVVVSTIVDLSHEQEMQAQLAAQRETIYQTEKMSALGELLAGVAHELNNPLSVVVGHALMLREEATDPEALRRIEKIGAAAERCAGIVRSFLAMARQEPAVLAPVTLAPVVETALDAFREGPGGERVAIACDLPATLPPILADADQVAQVLLNLMVNASQAIAAAGEGGLVEIEARHDAGAGMVEIRVSDDGPGVPEAIRGRIFDPLFTTKDVGQGTGIGLAFCHRVAASHGGEIRLDPRRGPGASFVLRLPVANMGEHGKPADAAAPGRMARARLLVVDDEADVAELIGEILRREGFDVDHAASGEAALELMDARRYALILTDLNMPGLGGRGFHDAVARRHPAMAARIAFVTGDTMSPAARGFLDAAGRPCLEKPIAPAELRGLVRDMLAGAGAAR